MPMPINPQESHSITEEMLNSHLPRAVRAFAANLLQQVGVQLDVCRVTVGSLLQLRIHTLATLAAVPGFGRVGFGAANERQVAVAQLVVPLARLSLHLPVQGASRDFAHITPA